MNATGKCLCGAVEIKITLPDGPVGMAACHCSMCRNWLGGPMLAFDSAALEGISDESSVTRYQSSEWAQRGFCNQCGTSLFYYLVPADAYHFPVGLWQRLESALEGSCLLLEVQSADLAPHLLGDHVSRLFYRNVSHHVTGLPTKKLGLIPDLVLSDCTEPAHERRFS